MTMKYWSFLNREIKLIVTNDTTFLNPDPLHHQRK